MSMGKLIKFEKSGKDLLYSLLLINQEVNEKLEKIEELRTIATGITAKTDKEAIQSSSDKDKIGSIVAKITDIESEVDELVDSYVARREVAKNIIFKIENEKYQNILYDFFIIRTPLYQVAENYEMKYNDCKAYRKRAIKVFEKFYNAIDCCD